MRSLIALCRPYSRMTRQRPVEGKRALAGGFGRRCKPPNGGLGGESPESFWLFWLSSIAKTCLKLSNTLHYCKTFCCIHAFVTFSNNLAAIFTVKNIVAHVILIYCN